MSPLHKPTQSLPTHRMTKKPRKEKEALKAPAPSLERLLRQETEDDVLDVEKTREEVRREAMIRGMPNAIEYVALHLLDHQQKEVAWLKQEKAALLAQLERSQKEKADLQGRLALSPEGNAQTIIDTSILTTQLSLRDYEQAKAVVDLIRDIHSLGLDRSMLGSSATLELQLLESKKNLNRALRCLVLENQYQVGTCISEITKFTDRQEAKDGMEPSIQVKFLRTMD